MAYEFYAAKRAPINGWVLDTTVPFTDYSGFGGSGGKKTGSTDPTTAVALVSGAAFSSVFKAGSVGKFVAPTFVQGLESRPFVLEAMVLPIPKTTTGDQQILSHDGIYDGLSINGKVIKFQTSYLTTGNAACTFDLQDYKAAYVVGLHSYDQNQLWVNGKMVASVDITDAQKADSYVATDGFLYSGHTASTQEIAIGAVAIYSSLSGEQIMQNYAAMLDALPQAKVGPQFDGLTLNMNAAQGATYIDRVWDSLAEFQGGYKNNVEFSPEAVVPSFDNGLSIAGDWTVAVPLDAQGDTSIYGVAVSWSGQAITVATSLDGSTWTTAVNGELISTITSGYNPTSKDLRVRVSFAGGLATDPAYLESLRVTAFRSNTFDNTATRAVTVSYPAVLRQDYEPNLFRDDNGVYLDGGTLTIATDTSTDPQIARTLELWIKVISGTPTVSVAGTKYRNGVASSTLNIGEWTLQHIVAASDVATNITITGDCIIGQVVVYPTALSASDVAFQYASYTGRSTFRATDGGTITVSEPATPTLLYDHDWSITGAG